METYKELHDQRCNGLLDELLEKVEVMINFASHYSELDDSIIAQNVATTIYTHMIQFLNSLLTDYKMEKNPDEVEKITKLLKKIEL